MLLLLIYLACSVKIYEIKEIQLWQEAKDKKEKKQLNSIIDFELIIGFQIKRPKKRILNFKNYTTTVK